MIHFERQDNPVVIESSFNLQGDSGASTRDTFDTCKGKEKKKRGAERL